MAYVTTKNIIDSKDNERLYLKGETFPREGLEVSAVRLKALSDGGYIVSDGAEVNEKPKRNRKNADTKVDTEV